MLDKEKVKSTIVEILSDFRTDFYDGVNPITLHAKLFNDVGLHYVLSKEDDGFTAKRSFSKNPLNDSGNTIINADKTVERLVEEFDGFAFQTDTTVQYVVGDYIVIKVRADEVSGIMAVASITFATKRKEINTIESMLRNCLVYEDVINDENSYTIAYKGQYSIETTVCKFNKWHTNIKDNYNDDIPYDKMNEIIRKDSAGLIMLYGEPGTGKTSIIKSLINENRTTKFIFIDSSMCDSISDGMFLDFLKENKGSVIVFEDCEKLLVSRKDAGNDSIGTILNLTDGIIAESMKIKFICTFNCKLSEIDEALLRKGRLTLKYEFKKLSLEKTKAICKDATKEMTLADAHNVLNENDYSKKVERKKIGF